MTQLIFHLIGDYLLQSDWMAQRKTKESWPALCHATVYSLPFLLIASWQAWFVIWSTHFFIDRFRLARYVCYVKNFLAPRKTIIDLSDFKAQTWWHPWSECSATGYTRTHLHG